MTKSNRPPYSGHADPGRIVQALRILAVPQGGSTAVLIAPGYLLCGKVLLGAGYNAYPIDPTMLHHLAPDADAVIATPVGQRRDAYNITILFAGVQLDNYRLCLLPRISGDVFFAAPNPDLPTFHIIRGRLVERTRPGFVSMKERMDAVARGHAALARLVGGR